MARDLSSILDSVLAGIVVLDREGRVELVNAAASRILEGSGESFLGRPVEELLGPDHSLAKLARTALVSGRSAAEDDCRVQRRFDSDLRVDMAASPLPDAAGKVDGAVVFLRDSTLQRGLQKIMSEREALAAFGHIAAGVAHEVKNPLGGIRGAAEILAARAGDAKTVDAAELIVREVDRIAGLLDDLMIFTQGESLRPAPSNVHRVLDDVLELVSMDPLSRGIAVERAYDPSIPEVWMDADRMTQVFLNLMRNALQALAGGPGTLRISTRMLLDHRITTPDGGLPPVVLVEVADDGPGIEEDVLEKLATPFFTTRPGGTGLGLALSRHWVARHGGSLRIESRPGAGTRACVSLPLRPPVARAPLPRGGAS
jgi:two-component system nitrogen regulation sensor histidine kinase GlnL